MDGDKFSKIGKVADGFDTFQLKSVLIRNDAGDWGAEPDNNAVGVIRSTNFNNNGKLDLSDIAYRTLTPKKFSEKKLCASDILIERSGGSETQPVGRVGFISDEIAKTDYAFANFIQRISLDDTVDAKFVYYCLQQMYEMGITAGMQSQTTGIRNLDWKQYIKVSLPKPSLSEQKAIATLLSKVDEAIEAVQGSIAAAERLKKSLMQNLLTGKMKPDGTFRTPEEFYTDEKFGKVPIGWEVKRIQDFGKVQTGKTPPTEEPGVFAEMGKGFMFITPGDVGINKYIEKTERYVSDKGMLYSYIIPANTVSEVCIGSTIGKIGITTEECCTNQQITSVVTNEQNDAEYFYYAMLARREHFKSVAGINATPQINKSEYSKYKILCPKTKEEQTSIAHKISIIDNQINNELQKKATLERLKKSLMLNLLTRLVRSF
jgi:type I restriction enzyme S subunit